MATATEVETTEAEEGGVRSQMWKHEAMVEWVNSESNVDLDAMSAAEVIAYAFAKRVAWRKSDTYRTLVDGHSESVAEAKAAEKLARDEERAAKAEVKAAEKAAADAAAAEKAEPQKATKATKAAPVTPTPAKTTTRKGKAASTAESPFG